MQRNRYLPAFVLERKQKYVRGVKSEASIFSPKRDGRKILEMLSGLKLHLSFHFYYFCFFFLFSLYPSLFLFLSISLFLSTSCLSISFSWFHSQVHSSADKISLLQANTPTPFLSHMLPHVHKHYSHWAHKLFLVHTHSLPLSPSLSMKRHGKFLVLPPLHNPLQVSKPLNLSFCLIGVSHN